MTKGKARIGEYWIFFVQQVFRQYSPEILRFMKIKVEARIYPKAKKILAISGKSSKMIQAIFISVEIIHI